MLDDAEAMDQLARALDAQGLDVAATAIRRLRLRVANVEARLDRACTETDDARARLHVERGTAQARLSETELALLALLQAVETGDAQALALAREQASEALGRDELAHAVRPGVASRS